MSADAFFAFARERHSTYLRRAAGHAKPWSSDPVLQTSRFTNVFRELDRTTAWFRTHVREPLRQKPEVLLATVIFRWFNRTTTGEAIFCQMDLDGRTAFEQFVGSCDAGDLRRGILALIPDGPYVTGAYTINTNMAPRGTPKLDGVLYLIQRWVEDHPWRSMAQAMLNNKEGVSLQTFCAWVQGDCLGDFMAYEVACDLRHTDLLCRAPDINTWANVGPGARRGVNRVHGAHPSSPMPDDDALASMVWLLGLSRDPCCWPQATSNLSLVWRGKRPLHVTPGQVPGDQWPQWELREVEHTLCEFDKYCRVREGTGQTRGKFDGK